MITLYDCARIGTCIALAVGLWWVTNTSSQQEVCEQRFSADTCAYALR